MTDLKQAVVVITGAAGGFGQELTRQLLAMDSRLILSDLDGDTLQRTTETLVQANDSTQGTVLGCIPADLSQPSECDRLYTEVQALCQTHQVDVDVLINNAGIALLGRMDEVPTDQWHRLMQINLLAPMWLSSAFATDMVARRRGHIVNMSSIAGWVAPPGLASYSASKFGLRGFSEGLSNELHPHNVRVTVVYPFFSRTPILKSPRYGSLAQIQPNFAEQQATDPAKVIRATLRGIQRDRLHVFPDAIARLIHPLKRWFPDSANTMIRRIASRPQP